MNTKQFKNLIKRMPCSQCAISKILEANFEDAEKTENISELNDILNELDIYILNSNEIGSEEAE